ncbi:hypothetical protein E8E11_005516 [Didymella keratinophila]|nr:hypothetical protein E8E11_005516 [Didymella keratinophila]
MTRLKLGLVSRDAGSSRAIEEKLCDPVVKLGETLAAPRAARANKKALVTVDEAQGDSLNKHAEYRKTAGKLLETRDKFIVKRDATIKAQGETIKARDATVKAQAQDIQEYKATTARLLDTVGKQGDMVEQ